jgi:flagellar biosynthesis/type III secretory pathway chaperone
MLHDAQKALLGEMNALLDQERATLLKGDLDGLQHILELKEALVERLNQSEKLSDVELAPLRTKAARNHELLDSAMQGIRAVADRMAELRRVRQGLQTYDRAGRKTEVELTTRHKLEKRA